MYTLLEMLRHLDRVTSRNRWMLSDLGSVSLGRVRWNQTVRGSSGDQYPSVVHLKAPFGGSKNKLEIMLSAFNDFPHKG